MGLCSMAFDPGHFDGPRPFGTHCPLEMVPKVPIRGKHPVFVALFTVGDSLEDEAGLVDRGLAITANMDGYMAGNGNDPSRNFGVGGPSRVATNVRTKLHTTRGLLNGGKLAFCTTCPVGRQGSAWPPDSSTIWCEAANKRELPAAI